MPSRCLGCSFTAHHLTACRQDGGGAPLFLYNKLELLEPRSDRGTAGQTPHICAVLVHAMTIEVTVLFSFKYHYAVHTLHLHRQRVLGPNIRGPL